jgi:Fe-S-cluster containining protein
MRFIDASEYSTKLAQIYTSLDSAYTEIADSYGFTCEGCEDNCCQSVFLHYTLVEHLYLLEGFRTLPEELRKDIIERAYKYNEAYCRVSRPEENLKLFCPLNYDAKCILYQHRPMTCRVYGVPGILKSPRGDIKEFEGCWRFKKLFGSAEAKLDRTPFYTEVANLEKQLRQKLVYYQRYCKTVAQMLIDEDRDTALLMRGYDIFEGY